MATQPNPFAPGALYTPPNSNAAILTAKPGVRFLSQAVQPPSQVYVALNDVLRIVAASSQANEVLTVNYRLLLPSGTIVAGQSSLQVSSDRAINIHDEPLAEGFLLSVSCKAAAATTRGQTFARIFLTNPALGQGQPSNMLMADYVTTAMAPAHPGGRVLAPTEGPGWVHFGQIPNPTPGSDFIIQVANNARVRALGVGAFFSTSAVVANRVPQLKIGDGIGKTIFQSPTGVQIGANSGNTFFSASAGFGGACVLPPPFGIENGLWGFPNDCLLLPPAQIYTLTINLQAGDQWNAVDFLIEEWLDNV